MGRIDTHNHIVPKFYDEMCKKVGSSNVDWPSPEWSVDIALNAMDSLNIKVAILSLSAPGCNLFGKEEARACARQVNDYCVEVMKSHPDRFGFFATIPSLTDVEGTLEELKYAFDVLNADGVTLLTSYNGHFLGNEDFKPIWQELDKRKATVFIHPTYSEDIKPINKFMPQPQVEFPYQTTRTATDLVLSNRIQENPNVKIILSHAGGFLPYAADRFVILAKGLVGCPKSINEMHNDFKKFYYDTALSSSDPAMTALLKYAHPDRILFGSDFPHAELPGSTYFTQQLDQYQFEEGQLEKINSQNALNLFPRFGKLFK